MNDIDIRKADFKNLKALQALSRETFIETFAESNSDENMAQYVEASFNEDKLTNELHNKGSQFYIAWDENVAVGYLKLNTGLAQTEEQDTNALEIERIYVKSAYLGKKVGQLLLNKALDTAVQQANTYVWLGVWEKNLRAIRFYEKNGFEAFDKHIFKMGDDEQTDIMMRKEL
ncbi:GNAT family N-acetyltransferase [Mucilaginibacter aquatilis]|uniref:GNAT family N-acetyltransferase n=1 Tax=Mucilaginibacter aquatilis TaxID=1517760 RepID=A0A6I4I960_9SPHI|nr:GNAT family N-acetyltransferase [Mucilaginibacter aquatilis]MVN89986.1 GNAT family N-acetyltransferase [Mucilaginibacter aquatilis]